MNFLNAVKNIYLHTLNMISKEIRFSEGTYLKTQIEKMINKIKFETSVKDIRSHVDGEREKITNYHFRKLIENATSDVDKYISKIDILAIRVDINSYMQKEAADLIQDVHTMYMFRRGIVDLQDTVSKNITYFLNYGQIKSKKDVILYRFLNYVNNCSLCKGYDYESPDAIFFKKREKGYRNLTLSGGGAKGIVYPGAIQALEDTNVLRSIKRVSGSSIGALVAFLVAIGIPAKEIKSFFDIHMKSLPNLFGKSNFLGIKRKGHIWHQTLDDLIIQTNNNFDSIMKTSNLTFSKLHEMRLKNSLVKELFVTATEASTEKLKIFSFYHTPDINVVDAVVASMAFPIGVAPIEIDKIKYIDGGYVDNIPTTIFDHYYEQQTLVFCFQFDDILRSMESSIAPKANATDTIMSKIGKIASNSTQHKVDNYNYEKIMLDRISNQNKKNIIPLLLPTDMSSADFKLAIENSEYFNKLSFGNVILSLKKNKFI